MTSSWDHNQLSAVTFVTMKIEFNKFYKTIACIYSNTFLSYDVAIPKG